MSKRKLEIDRSVRTIVDKLTLFDDDLMSRVFDRNIEATELLLRIILGRKIKVIRVDGQKEIKSPKVDGRKIILDILAEDAGLSSKVCKFFFTSRFVA